MPLDTDTAAVANAGDESASPPIDTAASPTADGPTTDRSDPVNRPRMVLLVLGTLAVGVTIGYLSWGRDLTSPLPTAAPAQQIAGDGYELSVSFGQIGPRLVEFGAIDRDRFVEVFRQSGQPLTIDQMAILRKGSNTPIMVDSANARFLLNFFWAFGLTNSNPLLDSGPISTNADGNIGRFASTGGWTIGAKSPVELFSSTPLTKLTAEQQARLEEVAYAVYRPCCNNPTAFPDCNHGMAMLGVLELMASNGSTVDEMFAAAKYLNAVWFPQQTAEVAMLFQHTRNQGFADIDPREMLGFETFSATGFRAAHQWLADNGLLGGSSQSGSSCGV